MYAMLAYLMQFIALCNSVCLNNACLFLFAYFALDFNIFIYANVFCFHHLPLCYLHINQVVNQVCFQQSITYISYEHNQYKHLESK